MLYRKHLMQYSDPNLNDDSDDSTNPGSADPWSDSNPDGYGTDTGGAPWP